MSASLVGSEMCIRDSPMSFRILSILPTVYRLWGRVRVRSLQGWMAKWDSEALFAGTSGKGAEEA
eukprot:12810097-Alexandrium_andersonii.AAC.1